LGPRDKDFQLEITAFETILVAPQTTWYKQVAVSVADAKNLVSYKFNEIPPVSPVKAQRSESHDLSMEPSAYEYWAFRLTADSTVTLNYELTDNAQFYLIKGE